MQIFDVRIVPVNLLLLMSACERFGSEVTVHPTRTTLLHFYHSDVTNDVIRVLGNHTDFG